MPHYRPLEVKILCAAQFIISREVPALGLELRVFIGTDVCNGQLEAFSFVAWLRPSLL